MIKILTLNTHSLVEANYQQKLEQFAEVICREQPDILAMQEVNQSVSAPAAGPGLLQGFVPCCGNEWLIREDNHAAQVARRLRRAGLSYSWTWISAKLGYGKYDEGMALFCRNTSIEETDAFYISQCHEYSNWKTRKVLGIRPGGSRDWFYNVHMGWWFDEDEPFVSQWGRLEDGLRRKKEAGRVWLLGDFNSPAEVRGQGYDCIYVSGWKDTWQMAEKKDCGITVEGAIDGWREYLLEQEAVRGMRIDHIWCSRQAPVSCSRVLFNGSGSPVVSDHFGVCLQVEDTWEHL